MPKKITGLERSLCAVALSLLMLLLIESSAVQGRARAAASSIAQAPVPIVGPTPVPLWEAGLVPGSLGRRDIDNPTITPYLSSDTAAEARPAMVICPGGGYAKLADHEGRNYALFLNTRGISCFVLKYRLGSSGYRHPVMLQDASRAVRLVRSRARQWKIDPARVGIMGSSAGGHLAATLLTHFDSGKPDAEDPVERQSSRPTLGVLCYAVISMQNDLTHSGSRRNLIGEQPSAELVENLSNERRVTADTPPCFIWHTGEDKVVKPENSLLFAAALQQNAVPYDLHIYRKAATESA